MQVEVVAMRRRWFGVLALLVLATAPGCRTMGYAAVAVGAKLGSHASGQGFTSAAMWKLALSLLMM